jgi:hypothetical protein
VAENDAMVFPPNRGGAQIMLSTSPEETEADFQPASKDVPIDTAAHDVQHGDKGVDEVEREALDSSGPSQGPSHHSVKVHDLQTKTASLMHRLEKIEVPRKVHEDETKDSIQGIPNIVAAPETPLTATHGPQLQPSVDQGGNRDKHELQTSHNAQVS